MMKVGVTVVLTLVLFFLIPVNSSLALSSVPPPTAQPPPVVNTPPSILAAGRTTVLPNTPWGLCLNLPQSCVIVHTVGRTIESSISICCQIVRILPTRLAMAVKIQ